MKKTTRILMLLSVTIFFTVNSSQAQQIVVGPRLGRPVRVIEMPMRPSPRRLWISEEWVPGGGTYAYHAGYWAIPPRHGAVWAAGHWRHRHHGYVWVGGLWR